MAEPYPSLAQARLETPVFWNDVMQCYVITTYADVVAVLKDTATFSSQYSIYSGEVPEEVRERLPDGYPTQVPSLINTDPPEHSRIRKIALSVLSPQRTEAWLPVVRNVVHESVAALPRGSRFDLMSTLAIPVPVQVICRMMGFPDADADKLKVWSDDIGALIGNPSVDAATRLAVSNSLGDFRDYLLGHTASRRAQRGSDLMSAFVWAGVDEPEGPMSDAEVISVTGQLLSAGNETTTSLIGNMTYLLLSDPDQWRAVCADQSLRSATVEEALRRMAPIKGLFRTTTRDAVVGGVRLEAERRVLVMYAAANHDPAMFSDPEDFDTTRERPHRHVAFGYGEHLCVGATLARLEARCVLDELCRFGNRLQLAGEPEIGGPVLGHGFLKLPLTLADAT
jgi:hypothetical protein